MGTGGVSIELAPEEPSATDNATRIGRPSVLFSRPATSGKQLHLHGKLPGSSLYVTNGIHLTGDVNRLLCLWNAAPAPPNTGPVQGKVLLVHTCGKQDAALAGGAPNHGDKQHHSDRTTLMCLVPRQTISSSQRPSDCYPPSHQPIFGSRKVSEIILKSLWGSYKKFMTKVFLSKFTTYII